MIGRIIPEAYDFEGQKTLIPIRRASPIFRPTFPMGRFIACRLSTTCQDFSDIRSFLATCTYVSDEEQFGRADYWLPPDRFEETRKGDCEDFALWTWRQLIELGYQSRFVVGFSGRYGDGHAWLTAVIDGENFLLEPQRYWIRNTVPRLSTLRYRPEISVEWNGDRFRYFKHRDLTYEPKFRELIPLVFEWLRVWVPLWPKETWAAIKKTARLIIRPILRRTGNAA